MDAALGIDIPQAGELLRKITLSAHNINSHAIHHFLIAPDVVPEDLFATAVKSVGEVRKATQFVVDTIAGEGIHPSDIRIGGMARNISPLAKEKITEKMVGLKDTLENHVELIKDLVYKADFPEDLGVVNQPLFVSDPNYGNPDAFDMNKFSEVLPEAWYGDEEVGKRACTVIPLLDGKNVETGPRARMEKFAGFKGKGTTAQHIARAEEMLVSYNDVLEKLDQLDTEAPARKEYDPLGTGELGIGVVEAPRGTNVHMATVKDGRTQFYSAIVPTTWNIPTMGPATEGFSHELAPHVIRAYDPCLSCATHVMVVDEEKQVLKNENMKI